ncbi:MAG: hypothetical protein JSS66_13725 [Armatimonadetes bacterium]|nr:hypothetical protein [Armatimonadota bacterium]
MKKGTVVALRLGVTIACLIWFAVVRTMSLFGFYGTSRSFETESRAANGLAQRCGLILSQSVTARNGLTSTCED